jgi:hypothetical protein
VVASVNLDPGTYLITADVEGSLSGQLVAGYTNDVACHLEVVAVLPPGVPAPPRQKSDSTSFFLDGGGNRTFFARITLDAPFAITVPSTAGVVCSLEAASPGSPPTSMTTRITALSTGGALHAGAQ